MCPASLVQQGSFLKSEMKKYDYFKDADIKFIGGCTGVLFVRPVFAMLFSNQVMPVRIKSLVGVRALLCLLCRPLFAGGWGV